MSAFIATGRKPTLNSKVHLIPKCAQQKNSYIHVCKGTRGVSDLIYGAWPFARSIACVAALQGARNGAHCLRTEDSKCNFN